MLFVLKKTIFEINNKHRQNFTLTEQKDKDFLKYFLKLITIINKILFYCLSDKISNENRVKAINYCVEIPLTFIKLLYTNKLSICKIIDNIEIVIFLFETLKLKKIKLEIVIIILRIFFKKLKTKNISLLQIKGKVSNLKFDAICLNYTPLRIVNYIINI